MIKIAGYDVFMAYITNEDGIKQHAPQRMDYKKTLMCQALLVNPKVSNKKLSEITGYGRDWIRRCRASPLIINKIREMAIEQLTEAGQKSLRGRIHAVIIQSTNVLMKSMNESSGKSSEVRVAIKALTAAADTLKKMGM